MACVRENNKKIFILRGARVNGRFVIALTYLPPYTGEYTRKLRGVCEYKVCNYYCYYAVVVLLMSFIIHRDDGVGDNETPGKFPIIPWSRAALQPNGGFAGFRPPPHEC